MKYCLKVNRVTEATRRIECITVRFSDEDYLLRLSVFMEEISNIQGVTRIASGSLDCIFIESNLSKESLFDEMEVFFKRDYCFLRYEDLSEI